MTLFRFCLQFMDVQAKIAHSHWQSVDASHARHQLRCLCFRGGLKGFQYSFAEFLSP